MKNLVRVLLGALLAAPMISTAWAEPGDLNLAASAALSWIEQIDAGQYDDSYSMASRAMHEKVPQDRWDLILRVERTPKGKVVSRAETGRSYKPNGFEGTDGEFMILTYATTFANSPNQIEQVVLRREDGVWKGAGYVLGPLGAEAAAEHAPDSSTTTTSTTTSTSTIPSSTPVTPLPAINQ